MTTRLTPLALAAGLLLIAAACGNPQPPPATAGGATGGATAAKKKPPQPVPAAVDIALKYQKGNGGKCMGRLADHKDYKHDVMWTTTIKFTIDKGNCDGFDPAKACIELSDADVLLGPAAAPGMPQQYCADSTMAINVTVSDDMVAVPNHTTHLYSIRYDRDSGDDPEFDVNCTTCDDR